MPWQPHISQLLQDTKSIQDENHCSCDNMKNSYVVWYYWNSVVADGQTTWNRVSNYTCFNQGEASVVDYLLVENYIHQKDENLKFYLLSLTQNIHPLLLLSELRP